MGKITIQSIASDLGLSRNTVSMALKGNELVTPRTRERILRYAEEIGYIGSLPRSDAHVEEETEISPYQVVILRKPDVAVYWDKVINGISEEACSNHCRPRVAVITREDEEKKRLPSGLDEGVQAVFCVKMLDREYVQRIKQMGIRVILLDDYKDDINERLGDVVKPESFQPTIRLTRHLIDQGMRRIGFLNENSGAYETMHDRFAGYLFAMRQAGIEPEPDLVKPDMGGEFYDVGNFERIVESYKVLPEAVVCGNDEIAKYLTQALRKKGLRVPEDVAVTGFDNDEEGMLDPFFSTVNIDVKWLGKRMVQCFLWRMAHPNAPYEKIVVSGEVIIRKSSIKLRKKDYKG